MISSASKWSLGILLLLIPAGLWVYQEEWFFPPEENASSLQARAEALERAIQISLRNHRERGRIVEALYLDDLAPVDAIEAFRKLNTEQPALWKMLKLRYPDHSDEDILCHQMIVAAFGLPYADSVDRMERADRIRGKLDAFMRRPCLTPRMVDGRVQW